MVTREEKQHIKDQPPPQIISEDDTPKEMDDISLSLSFGHVGRVSNSLRPEFPTHFSTNSLYRAHWTKTPYIFGIRPQIVILQ